MVKKTSTKTKARAKATRPRTAKPAVIAATEKDNAPVIRRELFNMETLSILLSSIILVVLLYSLYLGGTTAAPAQAANTNTIAAEFISDEASCKTFCEYYPQYGEGEFGGISENGHCLCKIAIDAMPNYAKNKTMSATILIDGGIIVKSATITDGAEQQQPFQMMQ
ncbi:MAG: hypothetical protein DRN71_05610 [Candidatus Nanohalarchaeota archaeon]|nr:MAG: hypothetical protein DRN71_05610 [Candidatus Nanohaloarchaeota archaeon]